MAIYRTYIHNVHLSRSQYKRGVMKLSASVPLPNQQSTASIFSSIDFVLEGVNVVQMFKYCVIKVSLDTCVTRQTKEYDLHKTTLTQ